jgi:hypothetical protein
MPTEEAFLACGETAENLFKANYRVLSASLN